MTLNPPDLDYLSHADDARVRLEVEHRRNAVRQLVLSGDYDAIKACLADWADDYASDFFRDVVGLIKHDEPSKDQAEARYWQIRLAAEKFLRRYLEAAIDETDVEIEMRREGLL